MNEDINFGAITEALNQKVDLPDPPRNAQDKIDYVVDWQLPTKENNYTWYRKYKSGWVEQGGRWTGNLNCAQGQEVIPTISIPIKMADNNYYATAVCINLYMLSMGQIKTQESIRFRFGAYSVARTLTEFVWEARGKAAQE